MSQRQVTEWSERQFVINRHNIWFGSAMPKTISGKEIIDNGIDQIADKKATEVKVHLAPNTIAVFDNGGGISLKKSQSGKTHLMLAVNKMYTSSNYEGTDGLAGTNGVGATATNFLSEHFKAGHIKDNTFTGYFFNKGSHKDGGETIDVLDTVEDLFIVDESSKGFYVEANFGDDILEDAIDMNWLLEYIKARTGELPEDTSVTVTIQAADGSKSVHKYSKVKGSDDYVNSWEEAVREVKSAEIVKLRNGWSYAFCDENNHFNNIKSIVQGAPVFNTTSMSIPFEIEDVVVPIKVPVTVYYRGRKNPAYTDQTKVKVTVKRADYLAALKSLKDLYRKYHSLAESRYLAKTLTDSKSSMYFPCSSESTNPELIISEGYSANSNIQAKRSYEFQACFALKGKVLNVMQMDLKTAMKSDVIRDFLNIILRNKFERIILVPDADSDGAHICTLLLGVIYKYARKYLEEGKVYYCKTPLYVFEKGKDVKWSDKASDCPKGYKLSVKKGLGSFTAPQVKRFITNPETRELWPFTFDNDEDVKALELALINGGKEWIIH